MIAGFRCVAGEDVGCFSHSEAVPACPMLNVRESDFAVETLSCPKL